jgi:hypothetical protein
LLGQLGGTELHPAALTVIEDGGLEIESVTGTSVVLVGGVVPKAM